MSSQVNEKLLERAAAIIDYYEDTVIQDCIENLIVNNELDQLSVIVNDMEADIARQEFFNNDVMGETDEY
jgi:hypothetical protein